MIDATQLHVEDGRITQVSQVDSATDEEEGWVSGLRVTIEKDGWVTCPKIPVPDFEVEVGMTATVYRTNSMGELVALDIDGRRVLERDEVQRAAEHALQVARNDARSVERFLEGGREEVEAGYEELPSLFQRRIDRFVRTKGPSWWWEYGAYEMVCCVDGVKIARVAAEELGLKPGMGVESEEDTARVEAWIADFMDLRFEEQREKVQGLDEGHSGNTFGMAVRLAFWWLVKPELVVLEHGALVPLVGCKEYGCPHPDSAEE